MVTDAKTPTRARGDALLQIRGLHIEGQSGDVWLPIVRGMDLSLARGEVLGLIGESGAGKSTLGLAAMGFARPGCRFSGGSINFDGIDLLAASEVQKSKLRGSRIAYVAQSAAAAFNPAHTLIDQYCETPVARGQASRAVAERDGVELYRQLLLPDPDKIGWRYPHQVSGGQLQRAMTAMAMACKPDLIIFDEPTTALDVTTQIDVLAAIRDIVRRYQTAAIYISHDLAVVAQMADRIMVLKDGRLVEEAPTRTMLAKPEQDYTKTLWAVRHFTRPQKPRGSRTEKPVLSIDHVTAGYGPITVLHDVTLELQRGRTVAVVGESGSGKSTLARCITGLLPPKRGRVTFNGAILPANYRARSREQLRQVQLIYQMPDTALNPKQRVRDVIGRPLELNLGMTGKVRDKRIAELLEMIELDPAKYGDRLPSELSGGQKQRVCIARALAADPKVILCDEVTSALDQIVAEGILKLLDRLQREFDLAYLFITHDLATVRAIADEVVVMQHGRIVEAGPKDEMFEPPHHPYTDLLLSSVPEMDPDWLDRVLVRRGADITVP